MTSNTIFGRGITRIDVLLAAKMLIAASIVGTLAMGPLAPALGSEPSGTVKVDGSSTVAPITMGMAEKFMSKNRGVRVTVGVSGTGGGFKKFLDDRADLRTDINDASRPIKESEMSRAKELGIGFIELPVAIDGLVVVVHPSNSFCDHLTLDELKRMWEPGSSINNWKDVRAGFPDLSLKLYGPGTDSGTFDYFTEVVVGKEKACRNDFTGSESDNVLVQGVSGDKGSLGYFGHAYYEANKSKLKLLAIDNGDGKPIAPNSIDVIRSGEYRPLSRPLFIYVNADSAKRPEVRAFVEFYLDNGPAVVEHPRIGYVALPPELYSVSMNRFRDGTAGSPMSTAPAGTVDLLKIFK